MAQVQTGDERRRYDRYDVRAHGTLIGADNDWTAHIINLSVSGALIAVLDEHPLEEDEAVTLQIDLDSGTPLRAHGRIAHIKEHFIGLEFDHRNEGEQQRAALENLVNQLAETE